MKYYSTVFIESYRILYFVISRPVGRVGGDFVLPVIATVVSHVEVDNHRFVSSLLHAGCGDVLDGGHLQQFSNKDVNHGVRLHEPVRTLLF